MCEVFIFMGIYIPLYIYLCFREKGYAVQHFQNKQFKYKRLRVKIGNTSQNFEDTAVTASS